MVLPFHDKVRPQTTLMELLEASQLLTIHVIAPKPLHHIVELELLLPYRPSDLSGQPLRPLIYTFTQHGGNTENFKLSIIILVPFIRSVSEILKVLYEPVFVLRKIKGT